VGYVLTNRGGIPEGLEHLTQHI